MLNVRLQVIGGVSSPHASSLHLEVKGGLCCLLSGWSQAPWVRKWMSMPVLHWKGPNFLHACFCLHTSITRMHKAIQFSRVQLFATSWILKLMFIKTLMPPNHLILCGPLLLPPLIFPSIRVFSNESVLCIRWPKYLSFSFSWIFSEYSGLISFRMNWLDLLAVQGTLKSLLQHRSSKASILRHSAFFMVQLSHPYMTARKTIALTIWTFVGKVMFLFFNTLPRFVIAFVPRNKHLLISWLQSLSVVILEPKKIKSVSVFTFSSFISHEVMGLNARS